MGVTPSSRAWETFHESFFFKEGMILSISGPIHCQWLFNIWIGLEIIHAICAGFSDDLILCGAYVDDVRS